MLSTFIGTDWNRRPVGNRRLAFEGRPSTQSPRGRGQGAEAKGILLECLLYDRWEALAFIVERYKSECLGLPCCMMLSWNISAGQSPKVFVRQEFARSLHAQSSAFVMSIGERPEVLLGKEWSPGIEAAVRSWVLLHRETLMAHWNHKLTSSAVWRRLEGSGNIPSRTLVPK